jgi:hypothetical protein
LATLLLVALLKVVLIRLLLLPLLHSLTLMVLMEVLPRLLLLLMMMLEEALSGVLQLRPLAHLLVMLFMVAGLLQQLLLLLLSLPLFGCPLRLVPLVLAHHLVRPPTCSLACSMCSGRLLLAAVPWRGHCGRDGQGQLQEGLSAHLQQPQRNAPRAITPFSDFLVDSHKFFGNCSNSMLWCSFRLQSTI